MFVLGTPEAKEAAPTGTRYASKGNSVRFWQQLMRGGIDATLEVDGDYGLRTKRATEEFQRRVDLPPDGIVWPETWEAMEAVIAALALAPKARPPISHGDRGEDVRYAQRQLNAQGGRVAVDGVFGTRMVSAVKQFQRRRRLRADGIVGPLTWAALG